MAAAELRVVSGLDRYTLNRQFRQVFGTLLSNDLIVWHLDRARPTTSSTELADIAAATGSSDQSHFTRQFKRAYGRRPAAWTRMLRR